MELVITDEATVAAVQRLAELTDKTPLEAIQEAVAHEYERQQRENHLMAAVRQAQEELDAISKPGGLPADKAFYDELSGEEELTGLP